MKTDLKNYPIPKNQGLININSKNKKKLLKS